MRELYLDFAAYNGWANAQLYAACHQLSPDQYHRDRRAFFSSIHGTLNHLLLTDRAWLGRFVGKPYAFASLRAELYANLDALQQARQLEDQRLTEYVAALKAETIQAELAYVNSSGQRFQQPLWQCLSHLFNHQTHHRGQVHQMLSEAGVPTPVSDLAVFLRSR